MSAGEMVVTPWGDSDKLRERRLTPGPGTSATAVAENQRHRLYGAMVASVGRQGYGAVRVADLSEISGVSSRSFYNLFPGGKEECFLVVLEHILDATLATLSSAGKDERDWELRLRDIYARFAEIVAAQPTTSTVVLTEAYAAGPPAAKVLDHAVSSFERLSAQRLKESPERGGLPEAMVYAQIGALQELTRTRLRRKDAEALVSLAPELAAFVAGFRRPPRPLKLATRTPSYEPESVVAHDDAERAIRGFIMAVAEHSYAGATIHEIARLGAMSPTTFYANFRDKREALLAAIDSSMAQLEALALAAYRRSPGWATGVRAAIGSVLSFLASRPSTANLLLVEVYSGGSDALRVRTHGVRELGRVLGEEGPSDHKVPRIAPEVIAGGIAALARRQLLRKGAETLPSLAPVCTYMALFPYIGAEEACRAANGDGRARPGPVDGAAASVPRAGHTKRAVNSILGRRSATAEMLAEELGLPLEKIVEYLTELEQDGAIEPVTARADGSPRDWIAKKRFRLIDGDEWEALTFPERRRTADEAMEHIASEIDRAIKRKVLCLRLNEHYTFTPIEVDREGWIELTEIHRAAFEATEVVKRESEKRLRESDGETIAGRTVQLLFEVPKDD
jgi:AcrR family transcriptional regulator